MNIRRFNTAGIAHFRAALASLRQGSRAGLPSELLADSRFSWEVTPRISLSQKKFETRREAAEYFRDILAPLGESETAFDAGLWTWLTLFFFDEVCPIKNGKRTVRNDYHYIYEPRNQRHFYRHLLSLGWRVLSISSEHNRIMLDVPLTVLDQATTEIMKRLYLIRIPCIFEVVDRIYWDGERERVRKGMVNPSRVNAGDMAHRFHSRIRQLEMTYDLQSLNAEQLLTLLGDEFAFNTTLAMAPV